MRQDLNKVLCEDSRNGGLDFTWYRKDKEHYDDHYEDLEDDMPHKGDSSRGRIGMRKIYGWDRRSFNEHLNPLRGWIHKNVGRPWNKVYSELCQVFDKRSVINQHILLHLDQYVTTTNIEVVEGKLYVMKPWRYQENRWQPLRESGVEWYVDPRNGILKFNKALLNRESRKKRNARYAKERWEEADVREYGNGIKLERENGIWYISKTVKNTGEWKEVEENRYDYSTTPATIKKVMVKRFIYNEIRNWSGRMSRDMYVKVSYKAMSKDELKQYGVENTFVESAGPSQAKLKKIERRAKMKAKK